MATRELQLSSPLIQPAAADASGIAVVNRPTSRQRHLLSSNGTRSQVSRRVTGTAQRGRADRAAAQ